MIIMCMICVDFKLGKLTRAEARRNATEFAATAQVDQEHLREIERLLDEGEKNENSSGGADPTKKKP